MTTAKAISYTNNIANYFTESVQYFFQLMLHQMGLPDLLLLPDHVVDRSSLGAINGSVQADDKLMRLPIFFFCVFAPIANSIWCTQHNFWICIVLELTLLSSPFLFSLLPTNLHWHASCTLFMLCFSIVCCFKVWKGHSWPVSFSLTKIAATHSNLSTMYCFSQCDNGHAVYVHHVWTARARTSFSSLVVLCD